MVFTDNHQIILVLHVILPVLYVLALEKINVMHADLTLGLHLLFIITFHIQPHYALLTVLMVSMQSMLLLDVSFVI
jgi:hypothetical protein